MEKFYACGFENEQKFNSPHEVPFAFGETLIAIDVKTIIHLGVTKWKM
jgi:hypothetical protein